MSLPLPIMIAAMMGGGSAPALTTEELVAEAAGAALYAMYSPASHDITGATQFRLLDQVGVKHLTSGATANNPTAVAGEVVFDGTNDWVDADVAADWSLLHNGVARVDWFLAFTVRADTGASQVIFGTSSSGAGVGVRANWFGGTLSVYISNGAAVTADVALAAGSRALLHCSKTAAGVLTITLYTATTTATDSASLTPSASEAFSFIVGARPGGSLPSTLDLEHLSVLNAPTPEQAAAVLAILQEQYELPGAA